MHELAVDVVDNAEFPARLCDGPLFVVGMFRSGTSLLYALLNQHPRIALMYEDELVDLHSLFWIPTKTSRWAAKWEFWTGACSRHKFDTSKIPLDIADLRTAVCEVYLQYARKKKGATIWGCKSPSYFDSVARLGRIFPNARFVIIWRDLRSICCSILEAAQQPSYFRSRGMLLRALVGYHEMKMQCDWLVERGFPVHQLDYEDLVSDPASTMGGICKFLRIPFDAKMTTLAGADRSAIDDAGHHSLVKSEKIVEFRKESCLPASELKNKIDRYLFLWRKQYGGSWPRYPRSLENATTGPSFWERSRDFTGYRGLRLWHRAKPVFLSLLPLRFWKAYDRLMGRRYEWRRNDLT